MSSSALRYARPRGHLARLVMIRPSLSNSVYAQTRRTRGCYAASRTVRSGESLREPSEHREVGVKLDALQPSDTERRAAVGSG